MESGVLHERAESYHCHGYQELTSHLYLCRLVSLQVCWPFCNWEETMATKTSYEVYMYMYLFRNNWLWRFSNRWSWCWTSVRVRESTCPRQQWFSCRKKSTRINRRTPWLREKQHLYYVSFSIYLYCLTECFSGFIVVDCPTLAILPVDAERWSIGTVWELLLLSSSLDGETFLLWGTERHQMSEWMNG